MIYRLNGLKTLLVCFVAFFVFAGDANGQGTKQDYRRAAELGPKFSAIMRSERPSVTWTDEGLILTIQQDGRKSYKRVDAKTGSIEDVDQPSELNQPTSLSPLTDWRRSRNSDVSVELTFQNTFDKPVRLYWVKFDGDLQKYQDIAPDSEYTISTFQSHVWVANFSADDLAGIFEAGAFNGVAKINQASQRQAMKRYDAQRSNTPAPAANLRIRNHNVWLQADGKDQQLTENGTADDPYRRPFHVSPDGKFALVFRRSKVTTRRIPLIESSPNDQVQPKVRWLNYAKPGDELSQQRPALLDLENARAIDVDAKPFQDSWSVRFQKWSTDGQHAYVMYNRRGHQELSLRCIERDGRVRDIVKETSKTFIDYSQKTMLHWLDQTGQLIWASERDGWNHLYRFDTKTGQVLNQITKGDWVVRDVQHVDEQQQVVWFTALGIHADQDPYHRHLARVNFDGTGLVILTDGDGSHQWEFNPDRSLLLDKWSRVDKASVWQLRDAKDGSLITDLWQQNLQRLEEAGYRKPIRFAAPGRDGKTMIYGHLITPTNFDPTVRYPIIEDIYAGPHDHHVGKRFGLQGRQRSLAELGFVVAKIDGMGTNWRSKKFHDVCWQNLADSGLPDRIAWIKAAAKKYPWLDISRVGIFGGSAGGQNSLAALLHHGDFYKAAVSDCGCHDNRMDKIWWNEAWMGKLGPHYAKNSNVTHANKLQGDLLLTVGEVDSNVDPASTMQVVNALIRADKDFDMIVVPGANHGVGESPYLQRRRQDFFVRKLLGVEPRR